MLSSSGRGWVKPSLSILVLVLGFPGGARAFAPGAAAAIATRASSALPEAAGWRPDWDGAAAVAVERRLAVEDADPERFAPLHRGPGTLPTDLSTAPDPAVDGGGALLELGDAWQALSAAFAANDADAIVESLARLAVASADLADPFQTTPLDREEAPGARAQFCDLLDETVLTGLRLEPGPSPDPAVAAATEAAQAGGRLAQASALERDAVEQAVARGDCEAVESLRRQRLEAALDLTATLLRRAWEEAGATGLGAGARASAIRVWPNPARAQATLGFSLPAAGPASLEIFDLAGRRVVLRDLGLRPSGDHRLSLEPGLLSGLAPGVYLVRVRAAGFAASGRLARVAP